MSTFDIFLALPLAYGLFQGFRKGLLQEVVSVFALFLGFILGLKLLTTALPVVQKFVGNALGLLPFLSFLVVFVLVILGVRLLGLPFGPGSAQLCDAFPESAANYPQRLVLRPALADMKMDSLTWLF